VWREAHALLRRRADAAPDLVRAAATLELPALPFAPRAVRAFVTTGVGSSAAHARVLAHLLAVELGLPARFAAAGAFVAPVADAGRDVLIAFSQGLSPNARLALATPGAWAGVVLITGVAADDPSTSADKHASLEALRRAGGVCIVQPGGTEYGTLLRVGGPLAGYAIAYRLAAAIGRAAALPVGHLDLDADAICAHMEAAAARAKTIWTQGDPFENPIVFLASGGYGERADNLALKVHEGLFVPAPQIADLIGFAHGPFQALCERAVTLLVLQRAGAALEDALVARLRSMLDASRHRLIMLPAALAGARTLFEHEAMVNEIVLRAIAAREIDQARWPGRDRERPLYDVATPEPAASAHARGAPAGAATAQSIGPSDAARSLATLAWPQLDALIAGGCRTAVLPLGATEQHGPHLPFSTDTWIADALAARFCERVAEAVRLPAVPLGCSAEHAAFPGTLSLRGETLRALLVDVMVGLAGHGFDSVFLFSAHGGNDAALRAMLSDLRDAAEPAQLIAVTGIDELTAIWRQAAAAAGVESAAAGHHAGELETSIMLGLRPDVVRRRDLAPGLLDVGDDPQAVFYPSLRAHSPSGVVGDPRRASAARAAPYLDAWVDALVAVYRREKKVKNTKGTQSS